MTDLFHLDSPNVLSLTGTCPLSLLPKLMSCSKGLTGFAKLLQDAFKPPPHHTHTVCSVGRGPENQGKDRQLLSLRWRLHDVSGWLKYLARLQF